ncbi:MAG TPA: helix-turn-helix transcriptional regulator [Pseudoxanthomonas sp.]|nr:helix-turn-helix transcriptional regulator [Pseudoxanthomonas sp.]
MTNVGERIRKARRIRGLTQGALADAVGVNRSAVAQWERHGGSNPSMEHLASVAVFTRVNLEWLGTNRGTIAAEHASPMFNVDEYAQSLEEAEILASVRSVSDKVRSSIAEMIKHLASTRR